MSDSDREREFYNIHNKEKSEIGEDVGKTIGAFAGSKAGEYFGGAVGQLAGGYVGGKVGGYLGSNINHIGTAYEMEDYNQRHYGTWIPP